MKEEDLMVDQNDNLSIEQQVSTRGCDNDWPNLWDLSHPSQPAEPKPDPLSETEE